MINVIFTLILYNLVNEVTDVYGSCLTPNYKLGQCVHVKKCKVIIDAIRTGNEEAMFFAKKSQCTTYVPGTFQNVCCGPDGTMNVTVFQHRLLPKYAQCGIEAHNNFDNKLFGYGGNEAIYTKFPWMVLLKYMEDQVEKFSCGGSLISRRYVLTAAHCTKLASGGNRKLIGVRLGEHKISTPIDCINGYTRKVCMDAPIDLEIDRVINHPGYSSRKWNNDISLIRLERDVQFTKYIRPICLPLDNSPFPVRLILGGWGETEFSAYSDVKIIVKLPVVNASVCEVKLGKKLEDSQFCAGGEDNHDSCNGDSGGPLVSEFEKVNLNQYIQYGIISYGLWDCGVKNVPAVYTKVSNYLEWIVSNLSE